MDREADDLARRIRREVLALRDPEPAAIFDHVYQEPHPLIDAERAWQAAYEASLEHEEVR